MRAGAWPEAPKVLRDSEELKYLELPNSWLELMKPQISMIKLPISINLDFI